MPDRSALFRALYDRGHRGVELGLDRVRRAASALGDPHRTVRAFHVSGTNGKGSTAAMLESIALEAGMRAGLYTSPHLVRLSERIRIGGAPIEDPALDEALGRVFSDGPADLTFFETLTLAAFVAFREAKVDVAVLEVGLGGRLDATNIVEDPLATGVVSITEGDGGTDLEHGALLGSTVAEIAREKAGICKPGAPLVIGPVSAAAREAILDVARARGAAPIWTVDREDPRLPALAPRLAGPHQLDNAAVAASMAMLARERGGAGLSAEVVERGIAAASWPGRMETIDVRGRRVILDAAHNVDGARALAAACGAARLSPATTILVFGALADKGFAAMLRVIAPLAERRIYTSPAGRSPASLESLSEIAPGDRHEGPRDAVEAAIAMAAARDTILVCGSIYLVGAVRAHLLGLEPDPVIAL